jgi:NADPH-dependent 2,4-dienoyl-CoA reductase/sulfur reductase-like enzyme
VADRRSKSSARTRAVDVARDVWTPAGPRPGSTSGIGPDAATLNTSVNVDVVVIGAGQAGLSAAYFLNRAGLEPDTGYVVLDANPEAGGASQHRWPSLKFGTAPGGGIRMLGTQVAEEPRLHLIGYGPSSSTVGATRAGRAAANAVVSLLSVWRQSSFATRPWDR